MVQDIRRRVGLCESAIPAIRNAQWKKACPPIGLAVEKGDLGYLALRSRGEMGNNNNPKRLT